VLSDGHFFHGTYDPANRTGHVRAGLLHRSDFLRRSA